MFNGIMDPELMRLAQEQMGRISPDELLKLQQQMMANPELMRLATESMKNLKPEDVRFAAEQMKHVRTEDMAEISERMARASPEEIAAMRAQADAQSVYQLQGVQNLKNQGNQLHALGKYTEAAQKYLHAKSNLIGVSFSEAKSLLLACSLNLMSCYLKTGQYGDCIREGSEVLAYDAMNIKALYRRGQAYKESGKLDLAVADLSKAVEVSPDDETIAQVLKQAREELMQQGGNQHNTYGPRIEEITEEEAVQWSSRTEMRVPDSAPVESSGTEYGSVGDQGPQQQNGFPTGGFPANSVRDEQIYAENLKTLSQNPDMIRNMHNLMANVDPESLSALSGGKITPDMVNAVSDMANRMSTDELQNMMKMTFQREMQVPVSAIDNIKKQPSTTGSGFLGSSSEDKHPSVESQNRLGDPFMNLSSSAAFSKMPNSTPEMQEQMRNQMKDPAMRQMFTTMIKNMNPEMMANMSEQFGFKLSREEAVKAQNAVSSLTPDDLDRLMTWAERIQRVSDSARKFKNWMLGRPGLIFAFCMLLLAIILHRLGYVGD